MVSYVSGDKEMRPNAYHTAKWYCEGAVALARSSRRTRVQNSGRRQGVEPGNTGKGKGVRMRGVAARVVVGG